MSSIMGTEYILVSPLIIFYKKLKKFLPYYTSIRRHLDYTSARLRRAVKVSSLFFDRLTDLKAEKTAVFALIRLRNSAVFLFSEIFLRIFGHFCTTKYATYPFVLALPHAHISRSLSNNKHVGLSLLGRIFYFFTFNRILIMP